MIANLYTCQDCKLVYSLSQERISQDLPSLDSFICDICADGE